jgi:hypothetical protein
VEQNITIKLDRERRFYFDWNIIGDLEEEYDLDVSVQGAFENRKLSHGLLRALVFAGLKHEDRKLTKTTVGRLLLEYVNRPVEEGGGTIGDVGLLVVRAIEASGLYGKPVDEAANGKAEEDKSSDAEKKNGLDGAQPSEA